MDSFRQKARQVLTSMGVIKKYNAIGDIVGDTIWDYPLVVGFPHDERNTALYRNRQAGHLLDTAALFLQDWESTSRTTKAPLMGDLKTFMASVDTSDIIQTSENTIRFLADESRMGSKIVVIIAMYAKLEALTRKDKGPVAYFMSSDKHCVCIGVGLEASWKGVKYLLEEAEVCKVMLNVSRDLPNLLLASEALTPTNFYCLQSQHTVLQKRLSLPTYPGKLPQFHRLYGVRNTVINASSDARMSNDTVLRYCHETKSVLRLWQLLMSDSDEVRLLFASGHKWKLTPMLLTYLDGHESVFPVKAIIHASRNVQQGRDVRISLLTGAHVVLTQPLKNHTDQMNTCYEEIWHIVSVMTSSWQPLPTCSNDCRRNFINDTVNFLVLKILPCDNYDVGSLGDIFRRMKVAMPNFMLRNDMATEW